MIIRRNTFHDDLTVLIPAAGRGERLGLGPKALLTLKGKPLIVWVANKALQLTDDVVIASPSELKNIIQDLCPNCRCITGGKSRQESVARLLASSVRDWVMLADVTRPFISLNLFQAVLAAAKDSGAAGAFLFQDVPVARLIDGELQEIVKAGEAALFQAPHAFSRELLIETYQEAEKQGWQAQSTLELVYRTGHHVSPVPGEKNNIKITSQADWHFAKALIGYLV